MHCITFAYGRECIKQILEFLHPMYTCKTQIHNAITIMQGLEPPLKAMYQVLH